MPLYLDLRSKRVVVFGGGEVGLRKASYLAKEAKVIVVSPDFSEDLVQSGLEFVKEDAMANLSRWVGWADMVVAATNDRHVNERIVEECARQSRPCNCADGVSTFLIPSTVERDGYTVAISTIGRSPAMSKYLRIMLEGKLTAEYDRMILLQEELRANAKGKIALQKDRERFLWEVLQDEDIWQEIRSGDIDAARRLAEARMVRYLGNDTECAHNS